MLEDNSFYLQSYVSEKTNFVIGEQAISLQKFIFFNQRNG